MITLNRTKTGNTGTFGEILDDSGTHLCYTIERPYTRDHPCINLGTYTFNKYNSPTKGWVWLRDDVAANDGRSEIELHIAQVYTQLLGCIGCGDSLGMLDGLPAVMHSRATFAMLQSTLPNSFTLTITGVTA